MNSDYSLTSDSFKWRIGIVNTIADNIPSSYATNFFSGHSCGKVNAIRNIIIIIRKRSYIWLAFLIYYT